MLLKYKKGNSGGNWNWSKEHTGMPPGSARRWCKPSGPNSQVRTERASGSGCAWPALCGEATFSEDKTTQRRAGISYPDTASLAEPQIMFEN